MRQIRHTLCLLCSLPLLWCMVACSSEDCPINNTVMGKMTFYDPYGEAVAFAGTLSVTAVRQQGDSVVINQKYGPSDVLFPLSYTHETDTLIFTYSNGGATATDSIYVSHTNTPTLVSVDCGTAIFHTITSVSSTRHVIDSLILKSSEVNYDERENIQIIYRTTD